ncbi:nad-dependent histone deacetylase sir2-like protein [Plasmopara halstedii]|uniref:Nad-dependent histone deacetylase sir2-like protein n=1 Tax=Plasmopara halstedii TaxID=4781 RepID=A0A0P1A539_PLAHL|nr:nad-dependent histone deacetylase sir2-like protein [Plasmopara halstedii]CEG35649.1 nad-dependent histone deacetylase sir2-like protein [Plasmopara halstedii]|eukprot:XP_024572018.1 nad-dependent histone deacetylase sir2-like protein [Plasmopara halstedii]
MEQSNPANRTVPVVSMRPPPHEATSPCSSSSSRGSPSGMGNRNRSVSMNMHSNAPPSKKQRASDDENEQATPPRAPASGPTSPYSTTEAVDPTLAISKVQDQAVDATEYSNIRQDQLDRFTAPKHGPALKSDRDSSSDESDVNEEAFLNWLMDQKTTGMPAGQMLDALGLGVADGAAVDDDELWEAMFSMGIRLIQSTATRPREKLDSVNTLQDVVSLLRSSEKIVVLAGAGISVSCGIPDFRSENGIYNRLGEYNLPNPQCMFDIEFFRSNPKPFFAFAKELFPKSNGFTFVPSPSHYFLKLLEEKGKLLRIYSQNIDMLEHAAGISHEHAVLCHGSFATATCLACKRMYPNDAIREDVQNQRVPMCRSCNSPDGIIKPDIVFFGESLPRRFHDSVKTDEGEADLVLVMGSSLKVNPVRSIVGRFKKDTPMILINREPVGRPHKFDVELLGYSDEIVHELCRLLGWDIPQPDPVLLGQSDLPLPPIASARALAPVSFEFVPPSRHLFNGSKSTYCSSSDEECSNSSGDESVGKEEAAQINSETVEVVLDADCEPKTSNHEGLSWKDQDELFGSGNDLLGTSSVNDN